MWACCSTGTPVMDSGRALHSTGADKAISRHLLQMWVKEVDERSPLLVAMPGHSHTFCTTKGSGKCIGLRCIESLAEMDRGQIDLELKGLDRDFKNFLHRKLGWPIIFVSNYVTNVSESETLLTFVHTIAHVTLAILGLSRVASTAIARVATRLGESDLSNDDSMGGRDEEARKNSDGAEGKAHGSPRFSDSSRKIRLAREALSSLIRAAFDLKLTGLSCELIALLFLSRARGVVPAYEISVPGERQADIVGISSPALAIFDAPDWHIKLNLPQLL
ncbi:hypothetical protein DFH09DRAFT_1069419 [Mycena vulgaris]|nr:hypothetical protein DFH09DRAFT_1069419 [Mycena vulgaris]